MAKFIIEKSKTAGESIKPLIAKLKPQKKAQPEGTKPTSLASPKKLQLLFTIVNKEKSEFFVDLLGSFEVNFQTILFAQGTANDQIMTLLGLTDNTKSLILSVIKKERSKEALNLLEEKFRTVKGGKGIAFTVPVSSTIGVAIYQFLSNTKNGGQR